MRFLTFRPPNLLVVSADDISVQSIKPERTAFSKYYLGRLAAQSNFSY